MKRIFLTGLFAVALCANDVAFAQEALTPRRRIAKPAKTIVDRTRHDAERIYVKFRDDVPVRLRTGKLAATGAHAKTMDAAAGLLQRMERGGAKWERQHSVSEEKLAEMRDKAQRATGKAMPDLNNAYIVRVPKGVSTAQFIDALNALDSVESAKPMPLPAPPPVVENYQSEQDYLEPTIGLDAEAAWNEPGGTGSDVRVVDIEYAWNFSHADLNASLSGPASFGSGPTGMQASIDHGTAVLGVMGGRNDGVGVRGFASNAIFFGIASAPATGYDPAAAITRATALLRAGDIMLLEMQTDGPLFMVDGNLAPTDLVPIEWIENVYDAIRIAVGNGIIVVEAAGNGNQNLDSPVFDDDHAPFLPANDSGAIIVGAGGASTGFGDRTRLGFSTYGSTVDVQGRGEIVVTTGYGDRNSADGPNRTYTRVFNGTSSASATIAGACAQLQGIYKASTGGQVLTPLEMREILRTTGLPQQPGTNPFRPVGQNIGPRPNLAAAIPYVRGLHTWVDFSFIPIPPILIETGSIDRPWNTFTEGVAAVPAGGSLIIKGGSSNENLSNITKPMNILNYGAPATIGQ